MGADIVSGTMAFVDIGKNVVIPFMIVLFILGVISRLVVYFTVRHNDWFVREFEKRVDQFVNSKDSGARYSFYVMTKKLLEKTFYELFEIRAIMKRHKPDFVTPISDRIFLIKEGTAWIVRDTLRFVRFLRTDRNVASDFLVISKNVFQRNPCFGKVFGVFPVGSFNEALNLLPGMFVIIGILGTFLGIMSALPELGGVDSNNVEKTTEVVGLFLSKTSFSMTASSIGILMMVVLSFFNTLLSPEKVFVGAIDRYESVLSVLWSKCDNNEIPDSISGFDEHRDPIEALAEQAVAREISKKDRSAHKREKEVDELKPTGT